MEGAHRQRVRVSLVNSKLISKVGKGVEGMGVVETFLIFSVTSFNLSVMSWRIRANELVTDAQAE